MEKKTYICQISQITPKKPYRFNLNPAEQIVIFQTASGYFALENRCPHAGAALHEGIMENNILTCHWHGWQFDVETGQSLNEYWVRLKTYSVLVEKGGLYVINNTDGEHSD